MLAMTVEDTLLHTTHVKLKVSTPRCIRRDICIYFKLNFLLMIHQTTLFQQLISKDKTFR